MALMPKIADETYRERPARAPAPAWRAALAEQEMRSLADGADPATVRPESFVGYVPALAAELEA